ncbi:MAG: hypothetical protein N2050_07195 [Flavobacteriales bacterium]|nr:hypothetical protein [Flavobacteriales bacterium]
MMTKNNIFAVWMDYSGARIGRPVNGEIQIESLDSGVETHLREEGQTADHTRFSPMHVSNNEHRNQNRHREQVKKYWKALAEKLHEAQGVHLIGPGEAKKEFAQYLKEHNKNLPAVLTVENSEALTERQLLARMRQLLS